MIYNNNNCNTIVRLLLNTYWVRRPVSAFCGHQDLCLITVCFLQSLRQVIASIDAGILLIGLRSICAWDRLDGLIKVWVTKVPITPSPHVSIPPLDGLLLVTYAQE